jgi:DNA-binding PadR family transcriptional regulator
MDATSQIPLNPRDYLVLLALTDGARHGYGLVKDIEAQSGGRVRVDPANLYRMLKRMISSGLVVESPEAARDDGDDRRRYYEITRFGREVVTLEAGRLAELTAVARSRHLLSEREATG